MIDVVEGGASIGFMLPIDAARAEAFWRRVAAGVDGGERVLFVADDGDGIVGTVQLVARAAGEPAAPRRRRQDDGRAIAPAVGASARR